MQRVPETTTARGERPRPLLGRLLVPCGVMLAAVAAAGAASADLTPHRAQYKVELVSATPGTGIANIDGVMVSDWDQSCEGWTLDQKMGLTVFDARGRKRLTMISNIATWESADGRFYRFSVNNVSPGGENERIEGSAEIPGKGKAGKARFTEPESKVVALPKGTLFPTFHALLVLKEAERAPTIVSRQVFDGLSAEGLHVVNVVVGRSVKEAAKRPELSGLRSWPINLAFFDAGSKSPEPDQEISMRLFENGVGEDMLLDFGNFKAKATLERLEIGKKPVCR